MRGCADEVRGQLVWGEGFHLQLAEADERATEVRQITAASIDKTHHGNGFASVFSHDIQRFLNTPAASHDVFYHEKLVSRVDYKAAPQHEFVIFFFRKNMGQPQLTRDFVPHD